MFNLFRTPQLVRMVENGMKSVNKPFVAAYCTGDLPKRMEKTINSVTLLGRVGSSPQLRGNEKSQVVTFSIATHTNYKIESGDWAQRTDWHQVAVFKPDLQENVTNYLTKGKRVLLYGRITYGEFRDKDGNLRTSTSIVADDITFFQ
ncbi:single-stranded DNA-binding protein, mitochondrial [Contarinia nasturtii]|uniref:single-stranded DNA-binding protein, mitochondrial n=1 Tax=Contarinia nasturtii TaxID=265458 RepID=UPI0012D3ACA4|nr:single-stranded DNA-binding protein, mitochondrial [Contarinia nasturtii]